MGSAKSEQRINITNSSSEKPKWEKTYIHTHFSIGRAFKFNSYFSKFNLNNVENFFPSYYIKKAELQRIDTFKLWCWRRLLRVSWTIRRSNQSILKEISPEYPLEGLMLSWNANTLATWWEELTHWKIPWCWERLKVGGEGNNRGWDGWMASLTQ